MLHSDNTRDSEAYAIIGGNQQGKSSLVKELVESSYDLRSDKVIILNSSKPKAFQSYVSADNPTQLTRKWKGIIRYHNPEGYTQTLDDIWKLADKGYFRNGCLVMDDCTKYIGFNPPEHIKYFLVDRAMFGLDIIFTTHALAFLPKWVRRMVNVITVFKTAETFEHERELKNLGYPNYEKLYQAWTEVMQAKQTKTYIQPNVSILTGI